MLSSEKRTSAMMKTKPGEQHCEVPPSGHLEAESEEKRRDKEHMLLRELQYEQNADLCWLCGKLLNSAKSLKVHLQKHSEENSCRDQTDQSSAERLNAESKVTDRNEDCKESEGTDSDGDGDCDETKAGPHLRKTQIQTSNNNLCWVCGKLLYSTKSLKMHLQTHKEENGCRDLTEDKQSSADCSDAQSKVADSYKEWKESEGSDSDGDKDQTAEGPHLQDTDSEDQMSNGYYCEVCGRSFRYRGWFLKHVQEDEKDTDLCGVCGKHFESEESLRLHLQTYIRTNDCKVCGRRFDGPKKLERHTRTHRKEKGYICSVCGKAFIHDGSLQEHMRVHTGEKPYVCSVCGQSFTFKGNIKAHMRIHTGEKPFLCSICGKGFRLKGTLQTHMVTHTGEGTHPCVLCGKRFTNSSSLKVHTMFHTGEKPYLCNICGKSFAITSSLSNHMRVHGERERTHCCHICRKRFWRKVDLKRHIETHRNFGRRLRDTLKINK